MLEFMGFFIFSPMGIAEEFWPREFLLLAALSSSSALKDGLVACVSFGLLL
jgi:hypothetical protein